jgi:hypothetical protein
VSGTGIEGYNVRREKTRGRMRVLRSPLDEIVRFLSS